MRPRLTRRTGLPLPIFLGLSGSFLAFWALIRMDNSSGGVHVWLSGDDGLSMMIPGAIAFFAGTALVCAGVVTASLACAGRLNTVVRVVSIFVGMAGALCLIYGIARFRQTHVLALHVAASSGIASGAMLIGCSRLSLVLLRRRNREASVGTPLAQKEELAGEQ